MFVRSKFFMLLLAFAALAGLSGCPSLKKPVESHAMAFSTDHDFTEWVNSGFPREVHKTVSMPGTDIGLYSFPPVFFSRQGDAMTANSRLQSSVRETPDIEGEYGGLRRIQEGVLRDYFTRNGMQVKKYSSALTRAILEDLRLGDLQPIAKPYSIVCYETYTASRDGVTEVAWMTVLCSSDNNNTPGSFLLNQIFLTPEAFRDVLLKQDRKFVREQEVTHW